MVDALYFHSAVEMLGWYNGKKSTPWSATNRTASKMYLACSWSARNDKNRTMDSIQESGSKVEQRKIRPISKHGRGHSRHDITDFRQNGWSDLRVPAHVMGGGGGGGGGQRCNWRSRR